MREFFQKMLRNKIIMAVISIVLGIVLIAWRSSAVAGILRVMGILILVGAVVCFITYFFGKANRGNASTLATAILCLIVGILFVCEPGWLIAFFPILMGLILIISSIFNISGLVSAPVKTGAFIPALIIAILTLVLGFISVLHPTGMANILIAFIGVTFLLNGVNDLLTTAVIGK